MMLMMMMQLEPCTQGAGGGSSVSGCGHRWRGWSFPLWFWLPVHFITESTDGILPITPMVSTVRHTTVTMMMMSVRGRIQPCSIYTATSEAQPPSCRLSLFSGVHS